MRKSKSFNLVNEEDIRKRDRLYAAQKCGWLKCLAIPALLGFVLLLILCNVDFSSKESEMHEIASLNINFTESTATAKALSNIKCTLASETTDCHVQCSDGQVNNDFAMVLENFQEQCNGPINVQLKDCSFPSGWMNRNTFNGKFRIRELIIQNCELTTFDYNVFDKNSTENLTTLTIVKSSIYSLTNYTFHGLKVLENFQLINYERLLSLDAVNFLQPLAQTLKQVRIMHENKRHPANNLTKWFGDANFKQLKSLNLSNTLFDDMLTHETFQRMPTLEVLILSHCGINSIGMGTFENVISTLNYLDLSNNLLKELHVDFLDLITTKDFKFEIFDNHWICDCRNFKLINLIQHAEFLYSEDPKCLAPPEKLNALMSEIFIDCDDDEKSTTMITYTQSWTDDSTTIAISKKTTDGTTTSSKPYTTMSTSDIQTTESSLTTQTDVNTRTATFYTTTTPGHQTTNSFFTTQPDVTTTTATFYTTTTTREPVKPTTTTTREPVEPTPKPLIGITCKNGETAIPKPIGQMKILTERKSNVLVHVQPNNMYSKLSLIYFNENNLSKAVARDIEIGTSTLYFDLSYSQSYEFCLIEGSSTQDIGNKKISPFDCRAYYLEEETWLMMKDIAWFVAVNVVGGLLLFLLSIVLMYFLLRWKPTLIRGNERFVRSKKNPKIMILLLHSNQGPNDSQNMDEEYHDYENPIHNQFNSTHSDKSQPPDENAPSIPMKSNRNKLEYQTQKLYEEIL